MFFDDETGVWGVSRLEQSLSKKRRHCQYLAAVLLVEIAPPFLDDAFVQTLTASVRAEDVVFQVSEKCLAVLLESYRHESDPLRVARRLKLKFPQALEGFGIAIVSTKFDSAGAILGAAQSALAGRPENSPIGFEDPQLALDSAQRLEYENDLMAAISGRQLKPFYQPIIELDRGQLRGFEALVRWNHPSKGLLLPEQFLQVAEDCGKLPEMDLFVLESALSQLKIWHEELGRPIRVNVNLCPYHFVVEGALEPLLAVIDAHREVRDFLRIDISEEVLLEERGLASLFALQGLKVGFHLDDFGVSPESFRCLHSFPFDSLKVDRTLIAEMEEEVNAELIAAVLRIAQRMKIRTTAEGLVTHAQLEELRQLGCDEAQGFLFSPAIDAEDALTFLKDGPRW